MEKNSNITICDYIANKVPNKAYELLVNEGFTFDKPKSKKEVANLLKQYVAMDRETALKKLAEIHPDKELLQSIDRELTQYRLFFDVKNSPVNTCPKCPPQR